MLCVHEAINGPAKLIIIVKLDEILSPLDVSAVHCFVMLCKSVYISTFSMLYVQLVLGHQLRKMLW